MSPISFLTVNAGSSSIRLDLLQRSRGGFERLATLHHARMRHREVTFLRAFMRDHAVQPDAILHRIVHGGPHYLEPTRVTLRDKRDEAERLSETDDSDLARRRFRDEQVLPLDGSVENRPWAPLRCHGDGSDRQVGVPADREGERAGVGDGEGIEASWSQLGDVFCGVNQPALFRGATESCCGEADHRRSVGTLPSAAQRCPGSTGARWRGGLSTKGFTRPRVRQVHQILAKIRVLRSLIFASSRL